MKYVYFLGGIIVIFITILGWACVKKDAIDLTIPSLITQKTFEPFDMSGQGSVDGKPAISKDIGLQYDIVSEKSNVRWKGRGIGKEYVGTVKIFSGNFEIKNVSVPEKNNIFEERFQGSVVLDMTTIASDKKIALLDEHLKNQDFFDVAQYPTSTFKLENIYSDDIRAASAKSYRAVGSLTIKNKTHPLEVPLQVIRRGSELRAVGKIVIDRTLWEIRYNSSSFFKDIGDKAIDNMIEFDLDIHLVQK
jgi:polyisoprenoid-binding protein YceI